MTFNELRKYCENRANQIDGLYAITVPVKVISYEPIFKSVEYIDGSKDEFTSEVPDTLPADSVFQIGADNFLEENQLRVFDGFNVLTIEIEDPDADFAYDFVDSMFEDEEE